MELDFAYKYIYNNFLTIYIFSIIIIIIIQYISYSSVHENYFKWHLVNSYIQYLGNSFLSNYYDYTTAVVGSGKVDRYLECISTLESLAPFSVSRLYTEYILPNGTKNNISVMVEAIKDAFEARLDENKWLDDVTRERSKWKVTM